MNQARLVATLTRRAASTGIIGLLLVAGALAQTRQTTTPAAQALTSPKQQFGHDIGDDYFLANYTQFEEYLLKLDKESDRMTVVNIGKTAEGRNEYTAIITSPENHRRLPAIKEANRRLALADNLTDDQARQLARDGKTIVWIDGGLHASEVLGAQQLIDLIYQLNARTDPETTRILNDDVVLCTNINPDGMELVSNWYMREPDERQRSTGGLPRLYQKYIGHDNNRDFYMMNQPESENANRMMYREWFPAIMYNHHQTGPAGAVLFAPPFRDPFNYNFDPLVVLGIDMVGSAIHTRLAVENKPGAVMRTGATYSTWFNGGIRTTAYFHNQIGILTEMIGNPTPVEIPFVPDMQLPRADVPNPIAPQTWHFRQSIEYSLTTNYAVLDLASKRKEDFLFNMYRMASNAVAKGNRDSWTIHPKRIDAVKAEVAKQENSGRASGRRASPALYSSVLQDPNMRDPRGFILPSDQPDFLTATKFVNILIKAGVIVHRATGAFTVAGKSYPAGSYVVKTAQPFRPHVLDMFEPQDHPDDIPYPGATPRAPYDVTGYNLSYSMGIKFDRILDGFDGPFTPLKDVVAPPPAVLASAPAAGGYLISRQMNDAFIAMNRLLKANEDVSALKSATTIGGKLYPAGTLFVPAKGGALNVLRQLATEKGLPAEAIPTTPAELTRLRRVRVGLWDTYGGSMPSGWTRWLLEQFEFSFEVVYPKTLDAGNLNSRFDVLIFVNGAIPANDGDGGNQPAPASIPPEYRDHLGSVTVARTVPQLKAFVEAGGTLLTIGSSTSIARHLNLPVKSALDEVVDGEETALPSSKFYVPGSILEAKVDTANPLALGMDERSYVFFDQSEAFRLLPDASSAGLKAVAWFDNPSPLKSGWAWGQQHLDQAVEVVEAPVGKGRVVLYGPEVAWRAQPHGTFKLLFNGIYLGAAQ